MPPGPTRFRLNFSNTIFLQHLGWNGGPLVSWWGVTLFVVRGLNHESQVACVASVSVGFQSKKGPKNGIFEVLALNPHGNACYAGNSQVA